MRLFFAEPAAGGLEDIIDYIAVDSPSAAERVYRDVVSAAERLRDFPEMGRAGRVPGTRELPVSSLPYLIVYDVPAESIIILAVFHTSRDLAAGLRQRLKGSKP